MMPRFYCASPVDGEIARVEGPEAHHLLHVRRVRPGDEIVLFDGTGFEFEAQVESVERQVVECRIRSRKLVDRESKTAVFMGVAIPKADRQHTLVEKCVELGVRQLTPLRTTRSAVFAGQSAETRFRRYVLEASKQCGRNRLMEITPTRSLHDFLALPSPTARRWFADRSAAPQTWPKASQPKGDVFLAIGPEGGWTEEEISQAETSGWERVYLGPRKLRTETAALALAAWWMLQGD